MFYRGTRIEHKSENKAVTNITSVYIHYDAYPENCGGFDTADFTANVLCCACVGGGGGGNFDSQINGINFFTFSAFLNK